jgi:hypothetical protein
MLLINFSFQADKQVQLERNLGNSKDLHCPTVVALSLLQGKAEASQVS